MLNARDRLERSTKLLVHDKNTHNIIHLSEVVATGHNSRGNGSIIHHIGHDKATDSMFSGAVDTGSAATMPKV